MAKTGENASALGPTETRFGTTGTFQDLGVSRLSGPDELELLDDYQYLGASRYGYINDLPNFIGLRRYTNSSDFKFSNLSVFDVSPAQFNPHSIFINFTEHRFVESGKSASDSFFYVSVPFLFIVREQEQQKVLESVEDSLACLGKYVISRDSITPSITIPKLGKKGTVLDYTYGPPESNELQRLSFKNSVGAAKKDIIARIYTPPKPKKFSEYFRITEEPSINLINKVNIEGQAFVGTNFESTIVESYTQALVQDETSPPEGPTNVDVGSFTYSTPTTNTPTY